jgi:hypothetical protein
MDMVVVVLSYVTVLNAYIASVHGLLITCTVYNSFYFGTFLEHWWHWPLPSRSMCLVLGFRNQHKIVSCFALSVTCKSDFSFRT